MIENRRWQNIPGAPQASLYPLIREAGATCSNSWIIQSAHALVVIDPGADPAQTTRIIEVLETQLFVRSRPVLVLLTHCHRDHAWACEPLLARGLAQAILIHHKGLAALESRDVELTMAGLFGEQVPRLNALVPLLVASGPATLEALMRKSVSGDAVLLGVPEAPSSERALPSRQCLELGAGAKIEILAMPGHSPDSVIFRLGDLWFVGDLLLAANPGVAGIPGWDALNVVHSLQMFRELISEQPSL